MKYLRTKNDPHSGVHGNAQDGEQETFNKTFEYEERYLRAKKKMEKLKGFYWHLAVYIIVNLFLILLVATRSSDESFFRFSTFSTAFFWGIGLFFHFLGVFGPDLMLGKNWEQKKMQEFIEKEEQRWE